MPRLLYSAALKLRCLPLLLLTVCVLAGGPVLAAAPGSDAQQQLVGQWLQDVGAGGDQVSVQVRALDNGESLLAVNEAATLNPASSIKLLTTYAGLLQLGADYRWQTRFYLDGKLVNGVLQGDLVLVGGGDPKLVIEDLLAALGQMRSAGLRHITGDLRLDNALYATPAAARVVFDGQASEPYNVWPDAAMLNFKSTKFVVTPRRGKAELTLDPPLAGITVHNRIQLTRGGCRFRASGLSIREQMPAGQTAGAPLLEVGGRYSQGCGQGHSFHAVLDHVSFSGALFRAAWEQLGGRWDGLARREPRRQQPRSEAPWYTWQSPRTLADIVTDINKFSNNVMTRQLMLQLAAERGEPVVDEASARRQVTATLRLQGLALPGLVLDNGAGLSRHARVSAAGLTELLAHAAAGPFADVLRLSLPVVGVDGTMRARLRKHPVAGNGWIKTGSLADVRSMAGYVDAQSGRRYALALIVNGAGARASLPMQDRLLRWVYENG